MFCIGLVFVLLSFEKSTNSNTILAFGMVFQYNTIRIDHWRAAAREAAEMANHEVDGSATVKEVESMK